MQKLMLLLTFFTICNCFAQKVDWVNAPRNPVVLWHTLTDFNLKGKVKIFRKNENLYEFDVNGMLIREILYNGSEIHSYVYNGNQILQGITKHDRVGEKVLVTMVQPVFQGTNIIKYNTTDNSETDGSTFKKQYQYSNNLLKLVSNYAGDTIQSYQYDANGRVIKILDKSFASIGIFESRFTYKNENKLIKLTTTFKNISKPKEVASIKVSYINTLGIENNSSNFSNINLDAKNNILNNSNQEMGYLYHDGTATGTKIPSEFISNSSLKSPEMLYEGLPMLDASCSGNCIDGYGYNKLKNGDTYTGFWKNNKPDGYGEYKFATGQDYSGSFENGMFSGLGFFNYDNNTKIYIGEFKNGTFNGFGNYHDKTTNVKKIGNFKDGQLISEVPLNGKKVGCIGGDCFNGSGIYVYGNTEVINGIFENSLPIKGSKSFSNGQVYLGEFKDSKFHNFGILISTKNNNDSYSGFWKNGLYSGKGKLFKNQTSYVGAFLNGKLITDMSKF